MIIHDCVQGTEQWLQLRAGIPTASQFHKILTRSGKASSQQETYMFFLLAEKMMGHPADDFKTEWMIRGTVMEAKAVAYYEFQRDLETVPIGFVTDDLVKRGASPDRRVGPKGLLEIKAPKPEKHAAYLLRDGSPYDNYRVQVQGQIWIVEGTEWSDCVSFHPEMPEALIRTEPDIPFIRLLSEAVLEFSYKLEQKAKEIADRGWMPQDRAKAEPVFSKETDLAYAAWQAGRSN